MVWPRRCIAKVAEAENPPALRVVDPHLDRLNESLIKLRSKA